MDIMCSLKTLWYFLQVLYTEGKVMIGGNSQVNGPKMRQLNLATFLESPSPMCFTPLTMHTV